MKDETFHFLGSLLTLLATIAFLVVFALSIAATVHLVNHGYPHIWLAWVIGFIPGFALPLFTHLRFIYIGAFFIMMLLYFFASAMRDS